MPVARSTDYTEAIAAEFVALAVDIVDCRSIALGYAFYGSLPDRSAPAAARPPNIRHQQGLGFAQTVVQRSATIRRWLSVAPQSRGRRTVPGSHIEVATDPQRTGTRCAARSSADLHCRAGRKSFIVYFQSPGARLVCMLCCNRRTSAACGLGTRSGLSVRCRRSCCRREIIGKVAVIAVDILARSFFQCTDWSTSPRYIRPDRPIRVYVPIFLESAQRIAHAWRIRTVSAVFYNIAARRISLAMPIRIVHRAVNVGHAVEAGALVLHGACRVLALSSCRLSRNSDHIRPRCPATTLNRRMVAQLLHMALISLQMGLWRKQGLCEGALLITHAMAFRCWLRR